MSKSKEERSPALRKDMVGLMLQSVERGDKKAARVLRNAAHRDPQVAAEVERRGLTFTSSASEQPKAGDGKPKATPAKVESIPSIPPPPVDAGPDVRNISQRNPYGPDSPHSVFRDMAYVAERRRATSAAIDAGFRVSNVNEMIVAHGDESVDAAERRLHTAREIEKRDITTAGGGVAFQSPYWFGQAVATAARATSRAADMTTARPLPEWGMTIDVPVTSTGVSAAVYEENAAITETDIASTDTSSPVITLAAEVEVSWQLLERSRGLVDQVVATDATAALGATLDVQVVNGSGSNGQLTGLLSQSGITETTYTDASPTVAEHRAKVWTLQRDVIVASGREPDVMVWGPTRSAWSKSGTDGSLNRQTLADDYPAPGLIVSAVPTTLGTGTNEDRLLLIHRDSVYLYASPVTYSVFTDPLSANGTVRLMARMYAALAVRTPSAVGVLKGTGCVIPTI